MLPLVPVFLCRDVRIKHELGETAARNPLLLFVFVRWLFQFRLNTPALELLFQLPETKGATRNVCNTLSTYPIRSQLAANPSTEHLSDFVNAKRCCGVST